MSVFVLIVGVIVASAHWRAVLAARLVALDGERMQAIGQAENAVRRLQLQLDARAPLEPPGYYDAPLPLGGSEHFWKDARLPFSPHSRAGFGAGSGTANGAATGGSGGGAGEAGGIPAGCAGRYHWSWTECANSGSDSTHSVVERMPSDLHEAQIHYRITVLATGSRSARVLLQVYHRVPDPGSTLNGSHDPHDPSDPGSAPQTGAEAHAANLPATSGEARTSGPL